MTRIKLALHVTGLDPAGTELSANNVYMALNNNPHFTNLAAFLPTLGTAINDLRSTLTSGTANKAAIRKRVVYVVQALKAVKGLVELECGDDEEKALSSGFTLVQQRSPKPKVFNATQGTASGTVDLVCPYAANHAAYVWEMSTDVNEAAGWRLFKISNTTSTHVSGLNPGIKYWFRVKAIVQDEEQPYSDPHLVHVV